MSEILDIFYDYTSKNKLLDKIAISSILDIILTYNNLENKISYVITKDNNVGHVLGEFDMISMIYVYYWEMLKRIRQKAYLTKFDKNYNLSDLEMMGKKNIFILETLFHEVEHVRQLETVKDISNKTLEGKLYQYEINFMHPYNDVIDTGIIKYCLNIIKHEMIYNRNYYLSFMERMANIRALGQIKDLLINLGDDFINLLGIQSAVLDEYMVAKYQGNLVGPTTRFICNLGYTKDFTKEDLIAVNDNLSFDDRFRYGFKITDAEYKKKIKR